MLRRVTLVLYETSCIWHTLCKEDQTFPYVLLCPVRSILVWRQYVFGLSIPLCVHTCWERHSLIGCRFRLVIFHYMNSMSYCDVQWPNS